MYICNGNYYDVHNIVYHWAKSCIGANIYEEANMFFLSVNFTSFFVVCEATSETAEEWVALWTYSNKEKRSICLYTHQNISGHQYCDNKFLLLQHKHKNCICRFKLRYSLQLQLWHAIEWKQIDSYSHDVYRLTWWMMWFSAKTQCIQLASQPASKPASCMSSERVRYLSMLLRCVSLNMSIGCCSNWIYRAGVTFNCRY